MLGASLALHVCIAGGVAISCFRIPSPPAKETSNATTASVLLLRAVATADAVQAPPSAKTAPSPVAIAPPATIPAAVPIRPETTKAVPDANPPAALALEANPNAHVRALPPESVLSPTPAPKLNGADGIVFILDVSGSMYEPYAGSTRLAFARQALSQHILALKDGTPFAITLYAKSACNSGPLVAANNDTRAAAVRYIMRDVDCGGGTNLPAGLASAVQLQTGSIILVSDGDWNMSAAAIMAQSGTILGPQGHCPSLTILGIAPRAAAGAGPLMQDLADQQGGTYATEQLDATPELVTSAANVTKPASAAR
jgi:hypothetical protein